MISLLDPNTISAETGCAVVYHRETTSTNDAARALATEKAPHGTVVLADSQTHGRGRRGAAWQGAPGRHFLGSLILRPALSPQYCARLTHACALAVCQTIEGIHPHGEVRIKWPNDVFIGGRKVCGILVEGSLTEHAAMLIVGVGVNLNLMPEEFPPDLQSTATSLWIENGGLLVDRTAFAIRLIRHLLHVTANACRDFSPILAACEQRSLLTGRRLTLLSNGCELTGHYRGMNAEGELMLENAEGTRLVSTADFVRPAEGAW